MWVHQFRPYRPPGHISKKWFPQRGVHFLRMYFVLVTIGIALIFAVIFIIFYLDNAFISI